jgi:hypothetical protein
VGFDYRRVPGFDDYAVGTDGSVWSFKRKNIKRMSPNTIKGGYKAVILTNEKGKSSKMVHRLVLEAFVGPCPKGMEALHKDHNPANCRLDNLRWGTHIENIEDGRREGRVKSGERNHWSTLTEEKVREMRIAAHAGETVRSIAARFGAGEKGVEYAVSGRSWAHIADPPPVELKKNKTIKMPMKNKINEDDVRQIRSLANDGLGYAEISRKFGVNPGTVALAVKRRTWAHVQ